MKRVIFLAILLVMVAIVSYQDNAPVDAQGGQNGSVVERIQTEGVLK